MDSKCLKNKHPDEMVSKDYFREWCKLKAKINLPLVFFWFTLEILNIALFTFYDLTLFWIEGRMPDT